MQERDYTVSLISVREREREETVNIFTEENLLLDVELRHLVVVKGL